MASAHHKGFVKPARNAEVCIVGGGPAGMMLGYLLARSGINIVVLEKHSDFLRDFRGDTVHPSTLEVLEACGLIRKFNLLRQRRIREGGIRVGKEVLRLIDFRGLRPFDFVALVPQWDFLNLIAEEARKLETFQLLLNHEVTGLVIEGGVVRGTSANTGDGTVTLRAALVVGCDGRHSVVRKSLGLAVNHLGAPMDALWFRMPRKPSDPEGLVAVLGAGHMMVMIDRRDYWQVAYIVPKGTDVVLRQQPISSFQQAISSLVPELGGGYDAIESWEDVKTLVVDVDRLERWFAPGALLIGDAAHTMSPIGGVGINLAIQDAVAAANVLAKTIHNHQPLDEKILSEVQRRRERPTRLMQGFQVAAQKRLISNILARSSEPPRIPGPIRWLSRFRWVRNIPARIVGYGFGREHVDTKNFNR